jgi:hypothetical protein
MPTQPEPSQSAVSLLDEALADTVLVRACVEGLRQPDAAIASPQALAERAERLLDGITAALRSARVRVADAEGGAPQKGQES